MKNTFIPKKSQKGIISIRIGTDLLSDVDRIAEKSSLSRNELIVQCIHFALGNFHESRK